MAVRGRAVKIRLSNTAAMQSLAEHLRRCGCIVADLDGLTIEASPPPRSLDAGIADLEVQAYVTVWRELNPEVKVVLIVAADRVAPLDA